MKFISTKLHGVLDYVYGIFLAASPWIVGFSVGPEGETETFIPLVMGTGIIIYSLVTDYEMGMYDLISVRVHLVIDVFVGLFVALSPWVFGFANEVYLPHLVLGLIPIVISFFTTTHKSRHQSNRDHHAAIMGHK